MPKTPDELEKLITDGLADHDKRLKDTDGKASSVRSDMDAVLKKIGVTDDDPAPAKPRSDAPKEGTTPKCGCGCTGPEGSHVFRIFPWPGWRKP